MAAVSALHLPVGAVVANDTTAYIRQPDTVDGTPVWHSTRGGYCPPWVVSQAIDGGADILRPTAPVGS